MSVRCQYFERLPESLFEWACHEEAAFVVDFHDDHYAACEAHATDFLRDEPDADAYPARKAGAYLWWLVTYRLFAAFVNDHDQVVWQTTRQWPALSSWPIYRSLLHRHQSPNR